MQAVVMAAGKGSRMLDLTGGGAKCLLPVCGYPLLYYPLKLLENSGFTSVILTVPDNIRSEAGKLGERYKLSLKLDVVGVPTQEEWGTLDTLRHLGDRLSGGDVLIVSGDLITSENLRKLADLHRSKRSGLTMMLHKPAFDLKSITVPGSKSNKYKSERDLIGLSAKHQVCLFKSEADVEDEISMSTRMLRKEARLTVYTSLQDAHLYIVKKRVLDILLDDKSMTTVKGEMIPKLVDLQFKKSKDPEDQMDVDTDVGNKGQQDKGLQCFAMLSDETSVRVNNIPAYWEAVRLVKEGLLPAHVDPFSIHKQAEISSHAQMKECCVGAGSVVSEKTNLSGVSIGGNVTINEKVVINNTVIMDNVHIASGVNVKDSILCEGASVGAGSSIQQCIVGKQFQVEPSTTATHQILLDADRMMQV